MKHIDSLVSQAMQLFSVPGLALAVVRDGRIELARGYGALAAGGSELVDEHSLFAIASISKTFTATGLAMLLDEGLLRWDDPVRDLLPGFQLWDPFASQEMRLRDLLIHNSGLPEVSGGTIWYGSDLPQREIVRRLRYLRPESSFRSRFAYQNVTFLAAGLIIEAVSGLSWEAFTRRRILEPLGMQRTATGMAELPYRQNIAQPHLLVKGRLAQLAHRNHDNVGPAAGMYASAVELAEYARLHLARGERSGQVLFSPQRSAELFRPHNPIPPSEKDAPSRFLTSPYNSYGLGWYVREAGGEKIVSHSGGVDGFRTLLTLVPERRLAVVVLSNSESPITHTLTAALLADAFGEPDDPVIARGHAWFEERRQRAQQVQAEKEAARQSGTQPSLALDAYCGSYLDPLVDAVHVRREGSGLVLSFEHTPAFTADLSHWHYDTFRLDWRDPYIPAGLAAFQLGPDGSVERLRFDQPNLLDVNFSELDPRRAPHGA